MSLQCKDVVLSCPSCPPCVVSYPEASWNIYCFQPLSDWRWSIVTRLSVRESRVFGRRRSSIDAVFRNVAGLTAVMNSDVHTVARTQ